jgi:hypothetical protein
MNPHHFVITVATSNGQGTLHGIHNAPEGETRQEAFESVLAYAAEKTGFRQPTVLFFSLEPNALGGPR